MTAGSQAGYVRIFLQFSEQVGVIARTATTSSGDVLILEFTQAVRINEPQRLADIAPNFISAARSDPDRMAIRVALTQKVKLHSIPSNKAFVLDLLPEHWTGPLPEPPK
jgi:hypothetical protein